MYLIIWKYQVKAARLIEFEKFYASNGTWAKLFRNGTGYISTELLRDEIHSQRYMTIDRWDTAKDYEAFHSKFKKEYETLDAQCEGLTEHEILLGKWETVIYETR